MNNLPNLNGNIFIFLKTDTLYEQKNGQIIGQALTKARVQILEMMVHLLTD